MSDAEIKKALECCYDLDSSAICHQCLLYQTENCRDGYLGLQALHLINRQKAEIERLRTANDNLGSILIGFMDEVSKWESKHGLDVSELPLIAIRGEAKEVVDKIKVEAIKEFAERLEDEAYGNDLYDRGSNPINAIPINILLQVKKEMIGDNNAE